jgi:hypothetical protein
LSAPERIAATLGTRFRTADAAELDPDAFLAAEQMLMQLADVVAATYFTTRERAEVRWEALA